MVLMGVLTTRQSVIKQLPDISNYSHLVGARVLAILYCEVNVTSRLSHFLTFINFHDVTVLVSIF